MPEVLEHPELWRPMPVESLEVNKKCPGLEYI
jgi:hypothetical protein